MNSDELIARYIETDPDWSSPETARIVGHGAHVWAVIGYMKNAVGGDADRTARDYDLPREAMDAALAYYKRNKRLIDAIIELKTIPAA